MVDGLEFSVAAWKLITQNSAKLPCHLCAIKTWNDNYHMEGLLTVSDFVTELRLHSLQKFKRV